MKRSIARDNQCKSKDDDLDIEIKDLEKKLGVDSNSIGKLKERLEKDGLFDLFNVLETSKEQGHLDMMEWKGQVKQRHPVENNECYQEQVEWSDVEFILKRISPLKHLPNFVTKYRYSDESSKKSIFDRLSEHYIVEREGRDCEREDLLVLLLLQTMIVYSTPTHIIHLFYQKIAENLNGKIAERVAYSLIFQLLDSEFVSDVIEYLIEKSRYDDAEKIIQVGGSCIRKNSPKSLVRITSLVDSFPLDSQAVKSMIFVLGKVRLNQDFEVRHPLNFTKFREANRKILKKQKSGREAWKVSLGDLIKSNFRDDKWYESFFVKTASESITHRHSALLEKYSEVTRRLKLENLNERLIVSSILDSKSYVEAAERIYKLRIFTSNVDSIVRSIFVLLNTEPEYNNYYGKLVDSLCGFVKELNFGFLRHIWSVYTSEKGDKSSGLTDNEYRMIGRCLGSDTFTFKLLKNMDFTTEDKDKKKINLRVLREVIGNMSAQQIRSNIQKFYSGEKNALALEELYEFAQKYKSGLLKGIGDGLDIQKVKEALDVLTNN